MVLLAASWQLRLVTVGSRMKKVPPDWTVLRATGFGPFQAAVPVPCMTCSWVPRTLPLTASTCTLSRLMPSALVPSTVDSQASRAVPPSAYTTSRVPSTVVTVRSCFFAIVTASAWLRVGVVDTLPTGCWSATELKTS